MATILKVKLLRPGARLPFRASESATGLDLYACLDTPVVLGPDVTLIGTGVALETPEGLDVQIRARSSLAKQGVNVILGTIDADYRGELFVAMYTLGTRISYEILNGDRIAQLVISRSEPVELVEMDTLTDSERGSGGYGSTGR